MTSNPVPLAGALPDSDDALTDVYSVPDGATGQCHVRVGMVSSIDGAAELNGESRSL